MKYTLRPKLQDVTINALQSVVCGHLAQVKFMELKNQLSCIYKLYCVYLYKLLLKPLTSMKFNVGINNKREPCGTICRQLTHRPVQGL